MPRKYRVSFSFVPLKAEFHYACIAENKEEAGKKARREIEKALNQIRDAIRPYQTDERLLIAANIIGAKYSEGAAYAGAGIRARVRVAGLGSMADFGAGSPEFRTPNFEFRLIRPAR